MDSSVAVSYLMFNHCICRNLILRQCLRNAEISSEEHAFVPPASSCTAVDLHQSTHTKRHLLAMGILRCLHLDLLEISMHRMTV